MTEPDLLRENEVLPPGFRPLGEFLDELEAAMAADTEREVQSVKMAIATALARKGATFDDAARAAIAALDQVRGQADPSG